jgi:hypothetical protein
MEQDEFFLVYVNPIGKENGDIYLYDFYFSKNPDIVWGYGWDCEFAAQEEIEPPDKQTYDEVKRLKTAIPLQCIQNNNSYSMRYAIENIISLAFEDISEYEEYPEDRIVLHFGEEYKSVEAKLALRHQLFVFP